MYDIIIKKGELMNKFLKDKDVRTLIFIFSTAGIIISTFVIAILNIGSIRTSLSGLFKVLSPFVWGCLFAIIINRLANKIEAVLPKQLNVKTRRTIGAISAVMVIIFIIALVISLIVPKLVVSISSLVNLVKTYIADPEIITERFKWLTISEEVSTNVLGYAKSMLESALDVVKNVIPNLVSATVATVSSLGNFVISLIICLYILIDKQKMAIGLKRVALAILNEKQYFQCRKILFLSLEKFSKFFSGKILDSAIIGVLCFICMLFVNKEYAALIAVVIGITNIVPFFGPIIGAVPCALLLLLVNPFDALLFMIIILILQQLDGNVIGPRILGDSVGLSSIWIMFSILVGGAYFGFFGMLLGVPVFSVIYYVLKEIVDNKLKEKEVS